VNYQSIVSATAAKTALHGMLVAVAPAGLGSAAFPAAPPMTVVAEAGAALQLPRAVPATPTSNMASTNMTSAASFTTSALHIVYQPDRRARRAARQAHAEQHQQQNVALARCWH
jgi:hypothetical protein